MNCVVFRWLGSYRTVTLEISACSLPRNCLSTLKLIFMVPAGTSDARARSRRPALTCSTTITNFISLSRTPTVGITSRKNSLSMD